MKEREKLLRDLISRMEDVCEKRKEKRVIRTFLVLSGVVYLAAFAWDGMNSIKDCLLWLIGAPLLAGLIIFGSALVMLHIHHGAMEDAKFIASLNGELNATVRFNRKNKDEL